MSKQDWEVITEDGDFRIEYVGWRPKEEANVYAVIDLLSLKATYWASGDGEIDPKRFKELQEFTEEYKKNLVMYRVEDTTSYDYEEILQVAYGLSVAKSDGVTIYKDDKPFQIVKPKIKFKVEDIEG